MVMAKPPFKKHRLKRLNGCLKTMLSSLQPINRLHVRRQAGAHCSVSPGAHCNASRHKPTHMTTRKQSTMDAFTSFSILTQALPSAKTIFKVLQGVSKTKLNQTGALNDKQDELHVVPTKFLASSCFEAILLSTVGCCTGSNASGVTAAPNSVVLYPSNLFSFGQSGSALFQQSSTDNSFNKLPHNTIVNSNLNSTHHFKLSTIQISQKCSTFDP